MTFDHNHNMLHPLRATLTWIVTPLQYIIDWPGKLSHWSHETLVSRNTLITRNRQLQDELLQLQGQLQRQLNLERENATLRALLKSSDRIQGHVLAAQLLAVNTAPFVNEVILNKGQQANVTVGQPVIDANGIMGQVVEANPLTSRVLLINDTRSAIPVQVNRNGIRAIAMGRGSTGDLTLLHVPETADIRVGDLLVTSGLGQRFPIGYPVADVSAVEHHSGEAFTTIMATPRAHLNRSRQVLLVWPQKNNLLAKQTASTEIK